MHNADKYDFKAMGQAIKEARRKCSHTSVIENVVVVLDIQSEIRLRHRNLKRLSKKGRDISF